MKYYVRRIKNAWCFSQKKADQAMEAAARHLPAHETAELEDTTDDVDEIFNSMSHADKVCILRDCID